MSNPARTTASPGNDGGGEHSASPGFYGKIPARGDFVRWGLPREIVEPWDVWLQAILPPLLQACEQHGDLAWPGLACWHFRLAAGVCGPAALCGIWLPSFDKVGRRFPLLVAAPLCAEALAQLHAMEAAGRLATTGQASPDQLSNDLSRLPACRALDAGAEATPLPSQCPANRWWRPGRGGLPLAEGCGHGLPELDWFERLLST